MSGVSLKRKFKDSNEDEVKKKCPVTLYNFGYAPKNVIEKFQDFCIHYPTLTSAIENLLKRDMLLSKKYKFVTSQVTYQMLARPTAKDDPTAIKASIMKLHKYAKDGRYKSVADSIEELLMSPHQTKPTNEANCSCFKATSCLNGSKVISSPQAQALESIADAVYKRLISTKHDQQQVCSVASADGSKNNVASEKTSWKAFNCKTQLASKNDKVGDESSPGGTFLTEVKSQMEATVAKHLGGGGGSSTSDVGKPHGEKVAPLLVPLKALRVDPDLTGYT